MSYYISDTRSICSDPFVLCVDKSNKRRCFMVKLCFALILVVSSTLVFAGDVITNINQCLNTNLTAEVLCRFPNDATSTVQNCVLTFVRGSVNGDLRMFASPFSPKIRFSEFGISDLNNIPLSLSNEFLALMTSVSNCTSRVMSCNEITNNGVVKVNVTLHRQGDGYNRVETSHLEIMSTNSFCRIISWYVDE